MGRNAEVVAALRTWSSAAPAERFLYVWGEAASGKSYLLAAAYAACLAAGRPVIFLTDDLLLAQTAAHVAGDAWVVLDGVNNLSADNQIALFHLYNHLKEGGGGLLASGTCPPAELALRPDLRTRLGWGLIYRLMALSEQEKSAALQSLADELGMVLGLEVVAYLLQHVPRDMASLFHVLLNLNNVSIALHRPITVPLVRTLLYGELAQWQSVSQ